MALLRKKSRASGDIPTSSMADIAFLLLVFFLVTTIFDEEKGLSIVLPEQGEDVEVSQNNILHLVIQPNGVVEVQRGESPQIQQVSPAEIGSIWRMEVAQNENLIAAVKTAPGAPYRYMVDVLDQLQVVGAERVNLGLL
ncbi:MAG TPA: biopolymer transporter ExbD, partial [Longimicrobiales bacterium]|nr:biopolymer transporter ExbD [Longimicrobiales bacterium]